MWFRLLILVGLICSWHGSAVAQLLCEFASPNEESYGYFGTAVSGAGDVNNDGFDDVIVGAPHESPGHSQAYVGRAYLFSGFDSSVLLELSSPNETTQGWFGCSVSGAGDVNDDGFNDVIVGAYGEEPGASLDNAGRAYVFCGASGGLLHVLVSPNEETGGAFGACVSAAGDVDDDGFDDVIVSATGEDPGSSPDGAGRAYVLSGATGYAIYTLASPNEETMGMFGYSVSGAGDVNNDGHDDLIVGAIGEDPGSSQNAAGRAYLFSGDSGEFLYTLVSPNDEAVGYFGCSVSELGDVNNDGYDDVIVGAMGEDPGSSPEQAGRAYIFSGETGEVLGQLSSPNEEHWGWFGSSVAGIGDANEDGHDDAIVGAVSEGSGAIPDNAGRAYLFCGSTSELLYSLISPHAEVAGEFGNSVCGVGDMNGDGFIDVIVGAHHEGPGGSPDDAGRAYVFTPPLMLRGDPVVGDLVLLWTPYDRAAAYWIYGATNLPSFGPGFAPSYDFRLAVLPSETTTWSSPNGIADPDNNWTYLVMAVDDVETELARSNRVGEHDFETAIP